MVKQTLSIFRLLRIQSRIVPKYLLRMLVLTGVWSSIGYSQDALPCSFPRMQLILMSGKSDLATAQLDMIEAWISESLSLTPQYFVVLERRHLTDILTEHRLSFEDFMTQSKSNPNFSNQLEGLQANYFLVFTANSSPSGSGYNFILKLVNISMLVQQDLYTATNVSLEELHLKHIPMFVSGIRTKHFATQVSIQTGKQKSRLEIVSTGDQGSPINRSDDFNGKFEITLPYGPYDISVNLKNYRHQTKSVCLLTPKETIDFSMKRRSGKIMLAGTDDTPQKVQIILDGKEINQFLPFSTEVNEGSHSIAVKKRGYSSWSRDLDIKDGDEFKAPDVQLIKKPIMTAMTLSAVLPGLGEFNLGFPKKGFLLSTSYAGAIASTALSTIYFNDTWNIYVKRNDLYESMETGDFNKAKQNAVNAYHAAQVWNTLRWTSAGAAAIIWGYSLFDTWELANRDDEGNLSLIPTSEGLALAYRF